MTSVPRRSRDDLCPLGASWWCNIRRLKHETSPLYKYEPVFLDSSVFFSFFRLFWLFFFSHWSPETGSRSVSITSLRFDFSGLTRGFALKTTWAAQNTIKEPHGSMMGGFFLSFSPRKEQTFKKRCLNYEIIDEILKYSNYVIISSHSTKCFLHVLKTKVKTVKSKKSSQKTTKKKSSSQKSSSSLPEESFITFRLCQRAEVHDYEIY